MRGSQHVDADRGAPFETLADWRSYADQIALVKVVSDRELPPDPEDVKNGAGIQGRMAHFVVEQTLWNARGHSAYQEFDAEVDGWVIHGDSRREMFTDGVRAEVGDEFVVPIAEIDGRPAVMTDVAVPVSGRNRGFDDQKAAAATRQLHGRARAEMAQLINAARPDPIADAHRDLDPIRRYRLVSQEHAAGH